MIKVSELKRHGIEVVAGDVITHDAVSETNANWVNTTNTHDHHDISEFAWRELTPVTAPEAGTHVKLDLKMQTDHLGGEFIYEGYKWYDETIQNRRLITHWRPSMEWLNSSEQAIPAQISLTSDLSEIKEYLQTDTPIDIEKAWKDPVPASQKHIDSLFVKMGEIFTPGESMSIKTQEVGVIARSEPVFTQEMVGTGRYEFLDCSDGEMLNNDWVEFEVVIVKDNILFGFSIIDEDKVPDALNGRHHKFRPLQTECEKAIESIVDILSEHESDVTELVKNHDTFKGAAQAIYDAGYRKS